MKIMLKKSENKYKKINKYKKMLKDKSMGPK